MRTTASTVVRIIAVLAAAAMIAAGIIDTKQQQPGASLVWLLGLSALAVSLVRHDWFGRMWFPTAALLMVAVDECLLHSGYSRLAWMGIGTIAFAIMFELWLHLDRPRRMTGWAGLIAIVAGIATRFLGAHGQTLYVAKLVELHGTLVLFVVVVWWWVSLFTNSLRPTGAAVNPPPGGAVRI